MASIRKRGNKYQVQVRRIRQASTSKSFHELKDAKAWARLMEVKADKGDLLADPKILKQTTLAEIVRRYRDTISPRKRSCDTERLVLSAFLLHPICRRRLSELRSEDFASYRDERLTEVKPSTVRRQLAIIKHVLAVARDEWSVPIQSNPLTRLQFNGADQRRERRLRLGEQERLLVSARQCRNQLIAPIVILALETAMRRGELLAIKNEHIDISKRSLLIPESKNGRARTIPLSIPALELLNAYAAREGRLFPISPNGFRLAWERVKRRAGIVDLHFHDLRHEAISRFFERGLSIPEVALISGHRDLRMLLRYTHPFAERILKKLDGSAN
jgi:integrase